MCDDTSRKVGILNERKVSSSATGTRNGRNVGGIRRCFDWHPKQADLDHFWSFRRENQQPISRHRFWDGFTDARSRISCFPRLMAALSGKSAVLRPSRCGFRSGWLWTRLSLLRLLAFCGTNGAIHLDPIGEALHGRDILLVVKGVYRLVERHQPVWRRTRIVIRINLFLPCPSYFPFIVLRHSGLVDFRTNDISCMTPNALERRALRAFSRLPRRHDSLSHGNLPARLDVPRPDFQTEFISA